MVTLMWSSGWWELSQGFGHQERTQVRGESRLKIEMILWHFQLFQQLLCCLVSCAIAITERLPCSVKGLSALQSGFNTHSIRIDSNWIEAVRNRIYLVSSRPHYNYSNQFKLQRLRHLMWFQRDLLMAFTELLLVFLFYLRLRSRHRRNRAVRARMRWLRQLALVPIMHLTHWKMDKNFYHVH